MATTEAKRRPNWTEGERMLLVEEVQKREDRLFGKFRGCGAKRGAVVKEEALEETMEALNAKSSQVKRTIDEGKKQYANLKQRAKEKNDAIRRPKTGGGPKPASPTMPEAAILETMGGKATLNGLAEGIDTEDFDANPCLLEEQPGVSMEFTNNNEQVLQSAIDLLVTQEGILQIPTIAATSTDATATTVATTSSSSTANAKSYVPQKKKMKLQEQELLTLEAEESKVRFEIVKLKEEAEYFRAKVSLIKLEQDKVKLEMEILRKQHHISSEE